MVSPPNKEDEVSYRGVTVRDSPFPESYDEYLEAIYRLSLKNPGGWVKNKDISERLNVKASSVTNMLEKLTKAELINWAPRKGITLTEIGRERAKLIVSYHIVIELFLARILHMTNQEEIERLACDFEHHFTPELKDRIIDLLGIKEDMKNIDNFISEDRFPKHILTKSLVSVNSVNVIFNKFEEKLSDIVDKLENSSMAKAKINDLSKLFLDQLKHLKS